MGHLSRDSLQSLFTLKSLKAAGVGALGAFIGFRLSSAVLESYISTGLYTQVDFFTRIFQQALLLTLIGAVLSAGILAWDNHSGMRGRWDRDMWRGLPLFLLMSFAMGGAGQFLYSILGISRAIPWMLMGAGIGACIGLLRRDRVQAMRGALGGVLGGLCGGLLVDGMLLISFTDYAFAMASQWGMIITGAMIAVFMGVVQDALKTSWLLGVSAGPYEGREYLLNTAKVTVGRSEASDIALYRLQGLPHHLGAFTNENGQWSWQGEAVNINGQPQTDVKLQPGDTIQFGDMFFRYQTRAFKTGDAAINPPGAAPSYPFNPPPPTSQTHFPTPEEVLRMGSSMTAPPPLAAPPQTAASVPPPVPSAPAATPQAGRGWILRGIEDPAHTIALPAAPAQATIGRAPGNSIVIEDQFISSQHARLTIGASMLTLTDLGSTNGSALNGQALEPNTRATMRAGDRLRLGHREYLVEPS